MPPYTYGDIPDTYPTKEFLPLGEFIFKFYSELGLDYFNEKVINPDVGFFQNSAEFLSEKFQIAVQTAKKVIDGEINTPENVITTWFFPPVIYIRSDLQMGTTKLLYGNSTDITFVVVDDAQYDVGLIINGHMENGVPVDYWYAFGDDEVLERRHQKLGFKMREIPKRTNNFVKSGYRILDILQDIRNERSPQWADSAYSICMVWITSAVNIFSDPSNWNGLAEIW
ncbi:MAG: hypothetical protein ACFFD2_30620, partial [Promethearchaeota archaeon]